MITVCVKCDIREAVNVSDWDEVVHLAEQAAKGEYDHELSEAPAPAAVAAVNDKAAKKPDD